ncbi:MAG: mechanosensitive ion channel family protein [Candidatus Latescibacterota bacterium]
MSPAILSKIVYSVVIIFIVHLVSQMLKHAAKKTQQRFGMRKSRYFAMRRLLTAMAVLLSLLVLILIWNVNVKDVWISLTGILALVAIAFFAVWSLVGNILAGIIIYFTTPFKMEDQIEVMPDGVRGTVLAINTFYTVLQDENMNYINVPNSLFFQKYIQVIKTKKTAQTPPEELLNAASEK